jgi:hypothetical protein
MCSNLDAVVVMRLSGCRSEMLNLGYSAVRDQDPTGCPEAS